MITSEPRTQRDSKQHRRDVLGLLLLPARLDDLGTGPPPALDKHLQELGYG